MAIEWLKDVPTVKRIWEEESTSFRLHAIHSLYMMLNKEAAEELDLMFPAAVLHEKYFVEKAKENIEKYLQTGKVPIEVERSRNRIQHLVDVKKQREEMPRDPMLERANLDGLEDSLKKASPVAEVKVSESSYKNGIILESEERVGWGSGMRLSVLREGGVDRLEVAMLPWASISGELRDEQGKPGANVKLELERYSMGIGMNDYAPPATCRPHFLEVTTDENGRFTCERLFPTALESGIDLPYKFKEVFEGPTGGNAVVLEAAVLQPGENLEVPLQATPRSSATVKWRF
ncbi:hypothetical protein MJH12_09250, partial [bacterium]|nr:hypothetical protein [bacterium]